MIPYSERAGDAPPHLRVAPVRAADAVQGSAGDPETGHRYGDAHQTQAQVPRDDQIRIDFSIYR